jgi:hypothetical protein
MSLATYHADVISAEQILIVRSKRVIELHLRNRYGNVARTVLRGRD